MSMKTSKLKIKMLKPKRMIKLRPIKRSRPRLTKTSEFFKPMKNSRLRLIKTSKLNRTMLKPKTRNKPRPMIKNKLLVLLRLLITSLQRNTLISSSNG